jgi:hypothetical protein
MDVIFDVVIDESISELIDAGVDGINARLDK